MKGSVAKSDIEDLTVGASPPQTFANRALQGVSAVIPLLVALSCLGALNGGFFSSPRWAPSFF